MIKIHRSSIVVLFLTLTVVSRTPNRPIFVFVMTLYMGQSCFVVSLLGLYMHIVINLLMPVTVSILKSQLKETFECYCWDVPIPNIEYFQVLY